MKALRLKLFQETACYKKPFASKVAETYPLPPYSTVKGMIHALLRADRFISMRLSVQGEYEAKLLDYQRHYFFKKLDTVAFPLILDGIQENRFVYDTNGISTMPIYTHMLYGVNLLIHVEVEDSVLEQVIQAIEGGGIHYSLGRWEDLVRIDEYKIVFVEELDEEKDLRYHAYISDHLLDIDTRHIPYEIPWKYEIVNGVRKWEKVKVGYVPKGTTAPEGVCIDEDGELVFFHL
ncbi:type I-B CRISPR-associated protein Cas5 [Geobacillus sp. 46C-IIa]|uniref:type I-B CRISPR-associated protein Cas5b n=1 Tax=Geobacillus sp. 46C-IIa TaxID=1963025 RepID=UPI0009BE5C1C|nr:type I-B CRISPR-associated protein Cas5b [Geobacillus sp. 46C-IIa]OQP05479.1 type I-B CRISPR-associated protein Cas5 [Geobacillus sp. 46C-IIa]QNU29161.1 type I-B CRISPR-associated protein Cas5 [Geobacillus sp. 46C-IIa]